MESGTGWDLWRVPVGCRDNWSPILDMHKSQRGIVLFKNSGAIKSSKSTILPRSAMGYAGWGLSWWRCGSKDSQHCMGTIGTRSEMVGSEGMARSWSVGLLNTWRNMRKLVRALLVKHRWLKAGTHRFHLREMLYFIWTHKELTA